MPSTLKRRKRAGKKGHSFVQRKRYVQRVNPSEIIINVMHAGLHEDGSDDFQRIHRSPSYHTFIGLPSRNMASEETSNQALRFHKDYDVYFDPDVYLRTHVNDVRSQVEKGLRQFLLDKLHAFCQRDDVTGETLLDVGCGPTITGVISAMNKFPDVYLSDISRPNRESLVKWLNNDPGHHDWSPFFKYILAKEGSSATWESRETALRSHIRGILHADVTMANPLFPCYFPPFDAIVSILCLDSAAKEVAEYQQNLKNLAQLLKPRGWALIVDNLQESHYGVGTEKFICASLTLEEFKNAWQDAGFSAEDIETDRLETDVKEGTINVALLARKL